MDESAVTAATIVLQQNLDHLLTLFLCLKVSDNDDALIHNVDDSLPSAAATETTNATATATAMATAMAPAMAPAMVPAMASAMEPAMAPAPATAPPAAAATAMETEI